MKKIWLGVVVYACNTSTLEAEVDDNTEHSMKPFGARMRLKHKRKKKCLTLKTPGGGGTRL